jgi:hypothetical protein
MMEFVSQVITIFSASNYYEVGSNKGAYVKLVGPQLAPHFVQFTTATPRTKKLTFRQRVGLVESSAIRELSGQILAKRDQLLEEFLKYDPEQSGETRLSYRKDESHWRGDSSYLKKSMVLWLIQLCSSEETRRFGGIYYINIQGIKVNYGRNQPESDCTLSSCDMFLRNIGLPPNYMTLQTK